MLVAGAPWQDYVFGSMEPDLASSVEIVPNTDYDGEWWRMVARQNLAHGGGPVNYIPRGMPSVTVICNIVVDRQASQDMQYGPVAAIERTGVIAARHWFLATGMLSRPQRGDEIETPAEVFYVDQAIPVQRRNPAGQLRDLKYRLRLAGASHRR